MHFVERLVIAASALVPALSAQAAACEARSGPLVPTVIELYTSEGCSSCPPADRWLSGLKAAAAQGQVVAQAFHVGYWDYIGWVDRFAAPAHTVRQRELAALNDLDTIYTPQLVRNGRDWRDWRRSSLASPPQPAGAAIVLRRPQPDAFEAEVVPADAEARWTAYWTVTEHGHSSKVDAGENRGERLQHDFVVRQYVPAGRHQGAQRLRLRPLPVDGNHPRRVNLVVFEPRTGRPLQALSLACAAP